MKRMLVKSQKDRARLLDYLAGLPEILWVVTIKKHTFTRTNPQNDKLHAVIRDIARHVGYTPDELKEIVKLKFLGEELVEINGQSVRRLKSTANLSVEDVTDLIDQLQAWGCDLGVEWTDEAR